MVCFTCTYIGIQYTYIYVVAKAVRTKTGWIKKNRHKMQTFIEAQIFTNSHSFNYRQINCCKMG